MLLLMVISQKRKRKRPEKRSRNEREEVKRVNNIERRRRIKGSEKEKRGSPMLVNELRQREDLICIVCNFHSVNILVMADFRLPA